MKSECAKCPFKANSEIGYTQDGLDCLDSGFEPECHIYTKPGYQFNNPTHSEKTDCVGFYNFVTGRVGFKRPFLENQ